MNTPTDAEMKLRAKFEKWLTAAKGGWELPLRRDEVETLLPLLATQESSQSDTAHHAFRSKELPGGTGVGFDSLPPVSPTAPGLEERATRWLKEEGYTSKHRAYKHMHASLTAEFQSLLDERAPLVKAAMRIRELCEGDSMERFERVADIFRKETGYMRPGKDSPTAYGDDDREKRIEVFEAWWQKQWDDFYTALPSPPQSGDRP